MEILKEGVHSGDASGVVPSSFRICKALISKLEKEKTGEIIPKEFHASAKVKASERKKEMRPNL